MLPSLYRDVLSCRAGDGDGVSMLAHAFEVKFNGFADEILCLIQRFGGDTKAGQVGSVGAPSGFGLFVDDEIFQFRPLLQGILQRRIPNCKRIAASTAVTSETDNSPSLERKRFFEAVVS